MTRALVLLLVLATSGCACAVPAGLTAIGVAGAVVLHDAGAVIAPAIECTACFARAARMR